MIGAIYLIHFTTKFRHCQHYLGWTVDLEKRVQTHRANKGACLITAINKVGIEWAVVRTWTGEKAVERNLKNWKKARQLCPVCISNRKLGIDKV